MSPPELNSAIRELRNESIISAAAGEHVDAYLAHSKADKLAKAAQSQTQGGTNV